MPTMADQATPTNDIELPPLPRAPWATMLTALLILFFFAASVLVVLEYSKDIGPHTADAATAEQHLQELRAAEKERLENYGYDAQTKTFSIPIERAMTILIEEGKAKGEMQSFPDPKPKVK